jgi:hypothetical protein
MPRDTNPKPEGARTGAGAGPWIVAALFAALALRQLQFVNTHAVNMMYADQWDFYRPMFLGMGWWDTFALQHGPHREGIGLVLTRAMANVDGWDSRWDAFAASLLLIASAALGIRLALCFGIPVRSLSLAAVPLLFMSVHQYEAFAGATNLSYGAVPIFLFMALCLCWFLRGSLPRLLAIGSLTFLLIFSGFGLFVGVLVPLLLLAEAVQAWRAREGTRALAAAAALALTGAGWILFARGYRFEPAAPGFRFPYEHPLEYVAFVGKMLGNSFGAAPLSRMGLFVGLMAAAALAAIALRSGAACLARGVAREPRSAVLFCLSAFTLLFCANCAVGRVFMGAIAPLAPRYATLLIPGGLALFLQLDALAPRGTVAGLAMLYTLLLVPCTTLRRADEIAGADWFADGRRAWKAAYLATHDEAAAGRVSHFSVYPGPLGDRLTYLENRRLNLFEGQPAP